jgi:hypothetical protein
MKKFLISMMGILFFSGIAYADEQLPTNVTIKLEPSMPQRIAHVPPAMQQNMIKAVPTVKAIEQVEKQRTTLKQCSETVNINSEQLFYITLTALNKLNYQISEVQSKTGTVIFRAADKEFVVTIANMGGDNTFIKILPTDSNYNFSPSIIQNVFYFVKANASVKPIIL